MTADLFIIGGGVNGCGIARDAAGRGLSVTLAEMGDLAQATSSASTKLFHGGLRYLEYYEFRLVREALIEREDLERDVLEVEGAEGGQDPAERVLHGLGRARGRGLSGLHAIGEDPRGHRAAFRSLPPPQRDRGARVDGRRGRVPGRRRPLVRAEEEELSGGLKGCSRRATGVRLATLGRGLSPG